MSFSLREAVPDDSEAVAALHVACWGETYRGLLPDKMIDAVNLPDRTVQWQRALPLHRAVGQIHGVDHLVGQQAAIGLAPAGHMQRGDGLAVVRHGFAQGEAHMNKDWPEAEASARKVTMPPSS